MSVPHLLVLLLPIFLMACAAGIPIVISRVFYDSFRSDHRYVIPGLLKNRE